jgi:HEAT repeat protein
MQRGVVMIVGRVSIVLGLLAAIVLVPACSTTRLREPVYAGKRLSSWMDELNREWKEDEPLAQVTARQEMWTNVVRAVGTNGLPLYLRWLGNSPRLQTHYGAQLAIQILGPAAEPAIPDLAQLLKNEETANAAAECLSAIGPVAIPALIEAVTTETNRGRSAAIWILGEFGPAANSAAAVLIQVINTDPAFADPAMRSLVEVETNTAIVLPLLAAHVSDSNNAAGATYALGRLGRPGIPILVESLTNQSRNIRCFAEGALDPDFQKYSLDNKDGAVPRFRTLTCIYNSKVLRTAFRSYAQGDFRVAAEIACRYTNDADVIIQAVASNALTCLRPFAETNVPQMKMVEENNFLPRGEP